MKSIQYRLDAGATAVLVSSVTRSPKPAAERRVAGFSEPRIPLTIAQPGPLVQDNATIASGRTAPFDQPHHVGNGKCIEPGDQKDVVRTMENALAAESMAPSPAKNGLGTRPAGGTLSPNSFR